MSVPSISAVVILGFLCMSSYSAVVDLSESTPASALKLSKEAEHKHPHQHHHSSAAVKEAKETLDFNYNFVPANLETVANFDAGVNVGNGATIEQLKFVFNGNKRAQFVNTGKCANPDLRELDLLLANYHTNVRKYEETIFQSNIKQINIETGNRPNNARLTDQSQCNANERNMTTVNQQSLCPWKYVVTYRQDKYPQFRVDVKCTCDSCTTWAKGVLAKSTYGCQPVIKTQPILVRSLCRDGKYQWIQSTEEVSVACVCAFVHNHVLHL